jgi:hypothetical protein
VTKKVRLVLFMAAATAFNAAAAVVCFVLLLLLYTALAVPRIPAEAAPLGLPLLFIASLALSFLIYRRVLKGYLKKHPLES